MCPVDTYCALCGVLISHKGFEFESGGYDQARLAESMESLHDLANSIGTQLLRRDVGPLEFHPADDNEQDGGSGYTHDTWEIQGSRLKTLRLWTDEWQTLTGLQFLEQNGAQSPRWGDCKTEGPVELDLQSSTGGWAKGLKVFIDPGDSVVVRVQLIEIESPRRGSIQ
ncbi:hypothetical protein NW754_000431 [Fusarium falciforme]|nr:hypothetical protein NW754_000431 [Fusarium falciforme]